MTKLERVRERWENARDILFEVGKELPGDRMTVLPMSAEVVARFMEWRRLATRRKPRPQRS